MGWVLIRRAGLGNRAPRGERGELRARRRPGEEAGEDGHADAGRRVPVAPIVVVVLPVVVPGVVVPHARVVVIPVLAPRTTSDLRTAGEAARSCLLATRPGHLDLRAAVHAVRVAPKPAAPKPAPTDCQYDYDPRTSDALKGKFDDHGCMYSNNACASCDDGCCNYVSCIYTMDDGCKKYDCLSPENCASLGGENHGNWQD